MANLAVTAANVRPLDGSISRHYNAGAAGIVPGDAVYLASDGDVEKSDGNVSNTLAAFRGIVTAIQGGKSSCAAGDRLTVTVFGPVAGFTGLTPGAPGYVSNDAGKLEDAVGAFQRFAGYAESATVFFVQPVMSTAASV